MSSKSLGGLENLSMDSTGRIEVVGRGGAQHQSSISAYSKALAKYHSLQPVCPQCEEAREFIRALSPTKNKMQSSGFYRVVFRFSRNTVANSPSCVMCRFLESFLLLDPYEENFVLASGVKDIGYLLDSMYYRKWVEPTDAALAYLYVVLPLSQTEFITPTIIKKNFDPWTGREFIIWPDNYDPTRTGAPTFERVGQRPDYERIRTWLSFCEKNHRDIHLPHVPARRGSFNFRLMDCSQNPPHIVEAPRDSHYVALSYVWGSYTANDSDTSNYNSLLNLPATVQDAVEVTLKLHFRYLWVDRYCIDQSNKEEKHHQIQNMDIIFHHADLTIIAASGESPDHGLPGVSHTSRTPQPRLDLPSLRLHSTLPQPAQQIQWSKWMTRGWTYQEAVLSVRRLIFMDHQAYFECPLMKRCESVDLKLDDKSLAQRINPASLIFPPFQHDNITTHIANYSRRSLTYDSDVLNAIAGIFRAYQQVPKIKDRIYQLSGVPLTQQVPTIDNTHQLVKGLGWFHPKPATRRPGFPSWSWIGWTGGVEWNLYLHVEDVDARIEIAADQEPSIDIEEYDFSNAPLYPSIPQRIRIHGETIRTRFVSAPSTDANGPRCRLYAIWRLVALRGKVFVTRASPVYFDTDIASSTLGTEVCLSSPFECLVLQPYLLLVLQHRTRSTAERIGIVCKDSEQPKPSFILDQSECAKWPEMQSISSLPRTQRTVTLV